MHAVLIDARVVAIVNSHPLLLSHKIAWQGGILLIAAKRLLPGLIIGNK